MPADIPHAALSDHFQERLVGRRVLSAVFLTFQLDPAFFELQVLPVFLDVSASHADGCEASSSRTHSARSKVTSPFTTTPTVSCLARARRSSTSGVSRCAEPRHLPSQECLPARREHRPPTRRRSCESSDCRFDVRESHRSGWWENVEACHVEALEEGARSRLRGRPPRVLRLSQALQRRRLRRAARSPR